MNVLLFTLIWLGQSGDLNSAHLADDVKNPALYSGTYEWDGDASSSSSDAYYTSGVPDGIYSSGDWDYPYDANTYWLGTTVVVSIEQSYDYLIDQIAPELFLYFTVDDNTKLINSYKIEDDLIQEGNIFDGSFTARIRFDPQSTYYGSLVTPHWRLVGDGIGETTISGQRSIWRQEPLHQRRRRPRRRRRSIHRRRRRRQPIPRLQPRPILRLQLPRPPIPRPILPRLGDRIRLPRIPLPRRRRRRIPPHPRVRVPRRPPR